MIFKDSFVQWDREVKWSSVVRLRKQCPRWMCRVSESVDYVDIECSSRSRVVRFPRMMRNEIGYVDWHGLWSMMDENRLKSWMQRVERVTLCVKVKLTGTDVWDSQPRWLLNWIHHQQWIELGLWFVHLFRGSLGGCFVILIHRIIISGRVHHHQLMWLGHYFLSTKEDYQHNTKYD